MVQHWISRISRAQYWFYSASLLDAIDPSTIIASIFLLWFSILSLIGFNLIWFDSIYSVRASSVNKINAVNGFLVWCWWFGQFFLLVKKVYFLSKFWLFNVRIFRVRPKKNWVKIDQLFGKKNCPNDDVFAINEFKWIKTQLGFIRSYMIMLQFNLISKSYFLIIIN